MRVIFLDIDGVLNSTEFAERHFAETGKGLFMYDFLDPDAVNRFKTFLEENTDVKIVLSSSWRYGDYKHTISDLEETWLKPILPYVVGETIRSYEGHRGKEIKHFLENVKNPKYNYLRKDGEDFTIESYVIVDDDRDMLEEQIPHFVNTDYNTGLVEEDYEKIKKILYA